MKCLLNITQTLKWWTRALRWTCSVLTLLTVTQKWVRCSWSLTILWWTTGYWHIPREERSLWWDVFLVINLPGKIVLLYVYFIDGPGQTQWVTKQSKKTWTFKRDLWRSRNLTRLRIEEKRKEKKSQELEYSKWFNTCIKL